MTQSLKIFSAILSVVTLLGLGACGPKTPETFTIDDPFIRATPQKISAGYFTITNNTGTDDALASITAPWAGKIELHNIIMTDDVMSMVPVETIALPAGQPVALKSGSYHVMLFDITDELKVGETRDATLNFVHAKPVTLTFKVKPITYKGLEHHH